MPTCILNTTSQRHDLSQIPNPFGETRVLYAADILSTETGLRLPEAELHPVNRSTRLVTPHPRFHSLSSAHEVLEKVSNCRRLVITCHAYAWFIFQELTFACLLSHSAFGSPLRRHSIRSLHQSTTSILYFAEPTSPYQEAGYAFQYGFTRRFCCPSPTHM
jgi:hypothetical protein